MLFGNPAWLPDHNHTIARLESIPRHTLAAQYSASTPFDIPYLHVSLFIGSFHVQERVWIAEQKLNDFPFDLLGLPFQIGRRERMVSRHRPGGKRQQDHDSEHCSHKMTHWFSLRCIALKDTGIIIRLSDLEDQILSYAASLYNSPPHCTQKTYFNPNCMIPGSDTDGDLSNVVLHRGLIFVA